MKYGYRTKDYDGLHNMYKKTRSEGFGPEVKRRIMLGSFVLSSGYYDAYYLKALRTKALIKKEFDRAFRNYDIILGPAAPTTAPELGKSLSDPMKMYLSDIYTISVNLAGTSWNQYSGRKRFQRSSGRHAAYRRLLPGEKNYPGSLHI